MKAAKGEGEDEPKAKSKIDSRDKVPADYVKPEGEPGDPEVM